MKLFISWSGAKSSIVAAFLHGWIPQIMNAVEPWMSETDLRAGVRWNKELDDHLSKTQFGIICLTKANLNMPWILFEAGALAKTMTATADTKVCPYLIDLESSRVPQGPLTQFHAKRADEKGTWELVSSINAALGDSARPNDQLRKTFVKWWPELEAALAPLQAEDSADEEMDNRFEDFERFSALGFESIDDDFTEIQKRLGGSKEIKVLKTWFPESKRIATGLRSAIQEQKATVELLLCKPGSILLRERSLGAHQDPWWGAVTVYQAVRNVYRWLVEAPGAVVHIALYDSWPGCPVIRYGETILMGFYFRGDSSPAFPWVTVKQGTELAKILKRQYDELFNHPKTIHLTTLGQMSTWLKRNKKWAMQNVRPKKGNQKWWI